MSTCLAVSDACEVEVRSAAARDSLLHAQPRSAFGVIWCRGGRSAHAKPAVSSFLCEAACRLTAPTSPQGAVDGLP